MENILNTQKLRQHNLKLIKDALKTIEYSTKNEIAELTGLSVATCGNLLKILIESGEVIEISLAQSTGGRPSRQFKFNVNYACHGQMILKLEKDKYAIIYSTCDLLGNELTTDKEIFELVTLDVIESIIKKMISESSNFTNLAIGLPGVVKEGSIGICDIKELSNINLREHLSTKFDLDIELENDVNATAIGFHHDNKTKNFAYIYYPYEVGPGAGIIVNNQLIRGVSNFAGEVGFMDISPKTFEDRVAKTITAITCVIDPGTIVVSGEVVTEEIVKDVIERLRTILPDRHIPEIIFEPNIEGNYLKGLSILTLLTRSTL